MKGQKFLKVTGILMIIGAALSILFGVIIGGVGALIAKFAGASTLGFAFYLGLATTLVGGIIQLIAGINGVKHCNKPENAKKCITWGIIVIALAVISNVLEVIGGGMRRRLMDLGFSAGEHVECVLKSPPGDPRAYLVRGTVTALRGKDAAEIKVRAEDGACNMCFADRCNSGAENKEG